MALPTRKRAASLASARAPSRSIVPASWKNLAPKTPSTSSISFSRIAVESANWFALQQWSVLLHRGGCGFKSVGSGALILYAFTLAGHTTSKLDHGDPPVRG